MRRFLFNAAGATSLFLGILGIFLPVLPTTPFILLASACFMRGSPAFHHWLINHKSFGPMIHNWEQHRGVTKKIKQRAVVLMLLSFGFSIWVVKFVWLKIALLVMLIVLLSWFIRLPIVESVADSEENH